MSSNKCPIPVNVQGSGRCSCLWQGLETDDFKFLSNPNNSKILWSERITCWNQTKVTTVRVMSLAGNKDEIVLVTGSSHPINIVTSKPSRTCSASPPRNSLLRYPFHNHLLTNYWNNHINNITLATTIIITKQNDWYLAKSSTNILEDPMKVFRS